MKKVTLFKRRLLKKEVFEAKDLKKAREKEGISIRTLAQMTGLSPAYLSSIELKKISIPEETKLKIEKAFA